MAGLRDASSSFSDFTSSCAGGDAGRAGDAGTGEGSLVSKSSTRGDEELALGEAGWSLVVRAATEGKRNIEIRRRNR